MNTPGFAAAASLYKATGQYRAVAGSPNALPGGREVLPQLPIGFCQANCDAIADPFLRTVCDLNCLGSGGQGSGAGGGSHSCLPRCGRCLPDPDSRTGRSRLCVRPNCEAVDRAC